MRNISDNIYRKSKRSFYEQLLVCGIISKDIVQPGKPQMSIWHIRILCWITKATNTHSEYVVFIALPHQQLLHERASVLRYTYIVCPGIISKSSFCCGSHCVLQVDRNVSKYWGGGGSTFDSHPRGLGRLLFTTFQLGYWWIFGSTVSIATCYGLDGPGIESRVGVAKFSAPLQAGPGAHPASCTMGTGSFPGVKNGQGVVLTTHPLLVPRSWKSRAIPLLPL